MAENLERLKQRVPLLEYLQRHNWKPCRTGSRQEFVGLCPLHHETRPSFYVNAAKNLFYCHGCGRGGDLIRFVQLFLDLPFRQTVAHLEQELLPAPVFRLLEETAAFYQLQLHRHPEAADYLQRRGVHEPSLIEELGIGYAPGGNLRRHLAAWVPEVYRLYERLVDVEGYIALHTNRYSVPVDWIGRRVEVRETRDKVAIQLDARRLVTHRRVPEAEPQRVRLPEPRPARGQRAPRPDPHPEEKAIVATVPELTDYVAGRKQRSRKIITLALRQLLRLVREYPREPLRGAVREAARYGLYDLDRLERMILRRVAREYFWLDGGSQDD